MLSLTGGKRPPRSSLLWVSAPCVRAITPTPGGKVVTLPSLFTTFIAFLASGLSRLLRQSRHRLLSGPSFRRCSVRLMLRPAHLLALLVRSDLRLSPGPPRTSTPELSQQEVALSLSQVSLHDTSGKVPWPDFHRLEHCRYRLHPEGEGFTDPQGEDSKKKDPRPFDRGSIGCCIGGSRASRARLLWLRWEPPHT